MCGKKHGDRYEVYGTGYHVFVQEYDFPHGKVQICENCKRHFTLQIWDFATPVVWLSGDDLWNEDLGAEHLTEKELSNLTGEELIELAQDTADALGDTFHETFHEAVGLAVNGWKEQKEKKKIEETPLKELPLLIGTLKYKRNIEILEKRLKGEK